MKLPRRPATLRLRGFDYRTPGVYLVTACTHERRRCLGKVSERGFEPSDLGELVHRTWEDTLGLSPGVSLDRIVVMPDHVHALVRLTRSRHAEGATSLLVLVGRAKGVASRRARAAALIGEEPLWQRGFFDRILRDEDELLRWRAYLDENPRRWHLAGKG